MAAASTPTLATILSGIVKTVAATALIGGGTMVLKTATDEAVTKTVLTDHDRRIAAVEKLTDRLDAVDHDVIILTERLRANPPPPSGAR